MKKAKILLLPLLLTSIIALFSVTGCATDGTGPAEPLPEGMTQQQFEQILAEASTNYEQLNTYKFDMDMDVSMEVIGGSEPGQMTMNSRTTGGINIAAQQMQMNMEMSMEGVGIIGSQSAYVEMYLVDDWVYMKMEMPGMDDQWIKTPSTDDFSAAFNTESVNLQMEILDSPLDVEYLRSQNIDGYDCYVLSVTPNMEEMASFLNQQNTGMEYMDWNDMVPELNSLFNKLSYVCYITKDTHVIMKMVMEMEMEYTSEQIDDFYGDYSLDFDKHTMAFYMDIYIYDHNLPFSVELPAEAEDAMEAPPGMF